MSKAQGLGKAIEIEPPVTMTEVAIEHVRAQLERRGSGVGVRLGVKKTGCSGYAYVVDFLDEPDPDDRKYPVAEDLAVYVDPESYPYVKGTQLDYVRQGLNSGFQFNNPNVKDTCGCGESFGV